MRLFIAINLPENAKDIISDSVQKLEKIYRDERFIPRENWHLTICFLGYQPDEAIGPILEATKETAAEFSKPEIELEKIILAPPDRPEKRMVWLAGAKKTSEILGELENNLEKKLIENKVKFKIDYPVFNSHLTLVRMEYPSRNFLPPELPDFRPIVFRTESLDLMESHLKRTGAEYEIISQFAFKA